MGIMKQTIVGLTVVWLSSSCTEVPAYRLEKGELFPDGKPVGQPYTSKRTDIRMVRVSSVTEADSFFVALCRNRQANVTMTYTHEVPERTYEVGIIYIHDSVINARGIREVHFVETFKTKRK